MNDAQRDVTIAFGFVLFAIMLRRKWFSKFVTWIQSVPAMSDS